MNKLILASILLWGYTADAAETTIRILGIFPTGANVSSTYMSDQLRMIPLAWNSTGLPSMAGVTVQILNGGNAVPVALPGIPNTNVSIAQWANDQPAVIAVRNSNFADVIILFHGNPPDPGTGACGASNIGFLNGNFHPNNEGLDLRFRNLDYVSVVGLNCFDGAAAHEFGHLLGAGHVNDLGLFPDSHSLVVRSTISHGGEPFTIDTGDVMANSSECGPATGADQCVRKLLYSRNVGTDDGTHQNARALATTAMSVANYFAPPPSTPPVAILNPPINVFGFLITACEIDRSSRHQMFWSPDPQTNVNVADYELWYSQPPGSPFRFAGAVPGFQTFSDLFIYGADSRVYSVACTTSACSGLSLTSYLARFNCNNL